MRRRRAATDDDESDNTSDSSADVEDFGRGDRAGHGRAIRDPTLAEIQSVFHMTAREAAVQLKIGVTKLKALCRSYGIARWPYRQVRALGLLDGASAGAPLAAPVQAVLDLAQARTGRSRSASHRQAHSSDGTGLQHQHQHQHQQQQQQQHHHQQQQLSTGVASLPPPVSHLLPSAHGQPLGPGLPSRAQPQGQAQTQAPTTIQSLQHGGLAALAASVAQAQPMSTGPSPNPSAGALAVPRPLYAAPGVPQLPMSGVVAPQVPPPPPALFLPVVPVTVPMTMSMPLAPEWATLPPMLTAPPAPARAVPPLVPPQLLPPVLPAALAGPAGVNNPDGGTGDGATDATPDLRYLVRRFFEFGSGSNPTPRFGSGGVP